MKIFESVAVLPQEDVWPLVPIDGPATVFPYLYGILDPPSVCKFQFC